MAKTASKASASSAPSRAGSTSDEMKTWAFLGVLLPIIGYVIILLTKKGGAYAEHYGKQGLVLGILGILFNILGWVLSWAFFLRWVMMILWLLWVLLWVLGIIYAFSGERKEIPVIGEYASKF